MAENNQTPAQRIPIMAYRSEERLTVVAPMPGVEPEDITVEVTNDGRLLIQAAGRGAFKHIKELLIDEWTVGAYERTVDLPLPVDAKLANVTYDNGVLVMVFPISEQTQAAQLSLEAVGRARGERVGSHGRDITPTSTAELTAAAKEHR